MGLGECGDWSQASQACPCHFVSSWLQLLRFQLQQPIINLLRKPKWEIATLPKPTPEAKPLQSWGAIASTTSWQLSLSGLLSGETTSSSRQLAAREGPGPKQPKDDRNSQPAIHLMRFLPPCPDGRTFQSTLGGRILNTHEASIPTLHSPLEDVKLLPARLCKLDEAGRECMLDKLLNRVWLHAKHTTESEQPTNPSHLRLALTGLTDGLHRSWGRPPVKLADLRPEINFADRILFSAHTLLSSAHTLHDDELHRRVAQCWLVHAEGRRHVSERLLCHSFASAPFHAASRSLNAWIHHLARVRVLSAHKNASAER